MKHFFSFTNALTQNDILHQTKPSGLIACFATFILPLILCTGWKKGFKYVTQLYSQGSFKTFASLQQELRFTFNHLQIRYNFTTLNLKTFYISSYAFKFNFYNTVSKPQIQWQQDIPGILGHNWQEFFNLYFDTTICARNKLNELRHFHRIYYTYTIANVLDA